MYLKGIYMYYKLLCFVVFIALSVLASKKTGIIDFNSVPELSERGKTEKYISMPYITKPSVIQVNVDQGDNIINILKSTGISDNESSAVIQSLKKVYNTNKIRVGDQVTIKMNGYNQISYIMINNQSSINNIRIYRDNEGKYHSQEVNNIRNKKILRASDTIRSSLFTSAVEQGLATSTVMKLINLYSHSVDLQKEIMPGSKFDVLFERFFDEDGNPVLDGKILYASLKIDNKNISLYHHILKNGNYGYFDTQGIGVNKAILQQPIEGAFWISSRFGNRKHPLYGYTRFHRGVDYAASIGTPIGAAGDGIIEYMGNRGGYGKFIKIKHNESYSTAYAHIGKFQKNLRIGSYVKQGQIIAFVGSTGESTGPHLHFEVLLNGKPIDPLKVSTTKSTKKLPSDELTLFRLARDEINKKLENTPYITEFAMNKQS